MVPIPLRFCCVRYGIWTVPYQGVDLTSLVSRPHRRATQIEPPASTQRQSIMIRRVLSTIFAAYFATFFFDSADVSAQDRASGIDPTTFDQSIRVQDDFYTAVNGAWLRDTKIPDDKSNYGSFTVLSDLSEERIREIIEDAAKKEHAKGTNEQKVGDLYRSFMDVEGVDRLGASPVTPEFTKIDQLSSQHDLMEYWGYGQQLGLDLPIGVHVSQDAKNSDTYIVHLWQGGTSLPDRDYYLEDDPKYVEARKALTTYIDTLFEACNLTVDGAANKVLELETKLARFQWERTRLRNADERYNRLTQSELQTLSPKVEWSTFLKSSLIDEPGDVIVTSPSFFEGLNTILAETPLETWKAYLKFHILDNAAPYLSSTFVDSHFEFHSKALSGIPEQRPRWKRGVQLVEGALGEVVGEMYVAKYFPPAAKKRMEELVANLIKAFDLSIDELTWMTDETKRRAKEKLSKFTVKIGYPNKWKDYSKLEIVPDELMQNVVNSSLVEYRRNIDKLGQPIDREEWGMTPQTVNAYYNSTKNEIVFPAAILQPPFFNMEADDAVNYGGIGAVIGHEISHGFDDQGSKYDGDGNLKSWWTAEDRHAFEQITKRLVDQYSEYSPLPGKTVDGQLTLGENIADLSGLAIAHKAYRLSLGDQVPPKIDNWTGDQRFFLGWSQVWRRKYRDAEMMRRLLTDPHAPSWYRANGPVINIDAFYTAFDVQPDDALFRPKEQRIKIW